MEIVKWKKSYETGIVQMDSQHKAVIDLINQLYLMIRDEQDQDELSDIIDVCLTYGNMHLRDEEQILMENEYPDLQEQLDDHAHYTETVAGLKLRLADSPKEVAPEMYKFLRNWWMSHVVEKDKKYGPFLQEKGVQ